MMVSDNRHDRVRKIDGAQDVRSDARVDLHLFEFSACELSGLVQDVLRNGQLPQVVEQAGRLDGFDQLLIRDAEASG